MSETFDFTAINALMRPPRMCLCRRVSERQIRDAVLISGARTFERVSSLTGCGTGCGTCETRITRLIEEVIAEAELEAGGNEKVP